MIRYGAGGLNISKILVKDLTDKLGEPFVLTNNVLESANEAFYLVNLDNLNFSELPENFDAKTLREIQGDICYDFVKNYLKAINLNGVVFKEHYQKPEPKIYYQYSNLCDVQVGVKEIIDFACNKYELVKVADLEDEMVLSIRNKYKSNIRGDNE